MLRIGLFILIFSHFSFSQSNNELTPTLGCYDDNFTMEVGMSLYDPNISNCQEAILYLNDFGYGCDTYLSEINNPFWGSNPNETIANICGCTCEEIVIDILGCTDLLACNYNLLATEDDGSCIYADLGFDCDGACLNDIDNDGICDEFDNCLYNEISIVVEGEDSDIGWNITEPGGGGWALASGGLGSYENLCFTDGCWNFNIYDGLGDGWSETYYSIYYSETNQLIRSGTLTTGSFCGTQISLGNSSPCPAILGCTDFIACNYDCSANEDDGNCIYPEPGDECNDGCLSDLDQDGICDDVCDDFDYLVVDCECNFLDPATYTVFFTNVDEQNCLIIDDCYCECINDFNGDGICDENEQEGCTNPVACNYDASIVPIGIDEESCFFPGDTCIAGILEGGEIIYGTYNEDCICIENNTLIKESLNDKTMIKAVDILGRSAQNKGFIIKIFNDGSVEKNIIME